MRTHKDSWEKWEDRIGYVANTIVLAILFGVFGVCWYFLTTCIIIGISRGEYVIAGAIIAFLLFLVASVASLAVHPVAKYWFR